MKFYKNTSKFIKMPFPTGLIEVRCSELQGKGLFARVDIPVNTVIWRFQAPAGDKNWENLGDGENQHYCMEEVLMMETDPTRLSTLLWGSYMHDPSGRLIELRDGDQYTNHSDNPNCGGDWSKNPADEFSITIRDVKAGDEITDDYGVFRDNETPWLAALFQKYTPERHAFESQQVTSYPRGYVTGLGGQQRETGKAVLVDYNEISANSSNSSVDA